MAEDFDGFLRSRLQSEMLRCTPGAPIEVVRTDLAWRVHRRRRHHLMAAVAAVSAVALVWALPHSGAAGTTPGRLDAGPPAISIPPDPTTTVGPPGLLYTFTDSDLGTTVTVPVGATTRLDLVGCPGTTWAPVSSSAATVVVATSFTSSPAAGTASATLTARSAGRAVLRAGSTSACVLSSAHSTLTVDVR